MQLKTMRDYVANDWESLAAANGLDSFESVWSLDIGWFEEPNVRRGGWSGVSRLELKLPDGSRERFPSSFPDGLTCGLSSLL